MSFIRAASLVVPALLLLPPAPALAQAAASSAETEIISALPYMIRWSGLALSVPIVIAAWMLLRFADRLVHNLGEVFTGRRLSLQKLNTFFRFAVYLLAVVAVVLLSFRISTEVLVLLGGTLAVAIGFALKDLAASVLSGVMMLFDRPFQVGDRVTFGGEYGDVISLGLRSVKLQTLDDNTVTIPNNVFLSGVTSCGNYGVLHMQVVVDFYIGTDQNVDRARELIREATATSRYVHLPKPIVVRVSQVIVENYVALRLRLKAYVLDTRYEKDFETDVTLRVLDAFREAEIQAPAILHRSWVEPASVANAANPLS